MEFEDNKKPTQEEINLVTAADLAIMEETRDKKKMMLNKVETQANKDLDPISVMNFMKLADSLEDNVVKTVKIREVVVKNKREDQSAANLSDFLLTLHKNDLKNMGLGGNQEAPSFTPSGEAVDENQTITGMDTQTLDEFRTRTGTD